MVADVQDEAGREIARQSGGVYVRADVSREADVAALVDQAVARYGALDCIFNNAGFAYDFRPIDQTPEHEFDRQMEVLVKGVFLGVKHAARVMKPRGAGVILNTGSVAGLQAGYSNHVYAAAKAAVIQLTRSTAMELGEAGIRVNCICPGGIVTPIFAGAMGVAGGAEATFPVLQQALAASQPIRRAGLPEDIANAAVFLASDEASFVNGHAFVVDGGLTGGRPYSVSEKMWAQLRAALAGNPQV